MPRAKKPLTKEMILAAMAKTKSNRAASRYLNVSYIHYKGYAKMYIDAVFSYKYQMFEMFPPKLVIENRKITVFSN